MKKLYTTSRYKRRHNRMLRKIQRRLHSRRITTLYKKRVSIANRKPYYVDDLKSTLNAPDDLRLMENTKDCLNFFTNLRSEKYLSQRNGNRFVSISLKDVKQIDYGSISILTAISDDLKFKKITLQGNFPIDIGCKQSIIGSGFLNHMYDPRGRAFPKAKKSELIFFEKGCGKLSIKDNIAISNTVKRVVEHLTGKFSQCLAVKSIILEICGNSIEWGGTDNRQWLLGVKYESDKVIFTVTDVGKGILETLHRKFRKALQDLFTGKSNAEILSGAFDQKYGSSTQEVNRNKGLPAVKYNFDNGSILNLKVLCNDVVLHFDDNSKSKTFGGKESQFKGTFYQWEMNKDCLNNL